MILSFINCVVLMLEPMLLL